MKSIMRAAAILAVVLCAVSCKRSDLEAPENGGLPISLTPSFGHSGAEQSAATRVTSTDFESGDALGLYVVSGGRQIELTGNFADNKRMEVGSSGAIEGIPSKVYYPGGGDEVDLYSYYPYDAAISSVRPYRFSVKVDQSLLDSYKASDFCYGLLSGVKPTTSARPISYRHKMSQVLVNVSTPAKIGDRRVTSLSGGVVYGVDNSAGVDFSTGVVSSVVSKVDSIVMYRDDNVTTTAAGSTTHFTAIIAPQVIDARGSGGLMSFVVTFDDNSVARYVYYNLAAIDIKASAANTLNLVIGDGGAVTLAGDPTVGAWASVTQSGIITQPINNTFTAIWKLPIKEYESIDRVVLGINDPISGTVKQFATTNFSLNGDHTADRVRFGFNFVISAADVLSYPYTIDYVEFFDGEKSLRQCKAVIAAGVTRRGEYTLGIEAEHVVAISVGTITSWDDLLYGDIMRGVDNDFRVSLIEYPHYGDIATLKLRIDGEVYTFNDAGCIAGSNFLLATTKDVRFPDANGKAPYKYPFTIENVSFYDGGGNLVSDGSYLSSVMVNRAGLVTLRLYRGVITSPTATVTGFNSSSGDGRPDFGGVVENNPLRVVYCYGSASSALSCMDVEKVDLVINNQTVTLAGYKALMTGTTLAAQSSAPHVNIAAGTGGKPTTYPYYISKITLRKADGTMLFSSTLDAPLKVDWYGEVTIEIMEKMEAGIAEFIDLDGLRWATGNLVGDGKGGCRIGAPGDGGLYFQFGGLIGYKGGADGLGRGRVDTTINKRGKFWGGADAFSENDIAITPAGYNKPKDIYPMFPGYAAGGYGYYYYTCVSSYGADFSKQPNGYDPSLGIGDPCRHYLGGDWRLPNYVEASAITGSTVNTWTPLPDPTIQVRWAENGPPANKTIGGWIGPNAYSGTPTLATDLFFPASGYRTRSGGSFNYVDRQFGFNSSSIATADRDVNMQYAVEIGFIARSSNLRAFAVPVRCVAGEKPTKPTPPAASDIIEFNGLRWTKGNLVANGANGARVGAPGDGGLYFQYGGLIGYKGGATGDGSGTIDPELEGKFWGGAAAFSSNDVAVTPTGYTKPTNAYPNFDNQASGGYGYYYYNSFVTKYADFQTQPNGKDISLGIGDACEVYLGSPWRLPNYIELSAITGSANEGGYVSWSDAYLTAKWVVNGPSSGRTMGAWFGPNSKTGNPNTNTDLFLPASGFHHSNGAFLNVGNYGYSMSSSINTATHKFYLGIWDLNGVYTRSGSARTHGMPVRCVADDVVEIGGVKWAKGNLVANGPNTCVIGKPGDGGLYFQYGGLVGYKGGAAGDGRGIVDAAKHPNGVWWNGATAYSANDIAVTPAGYTSSKTTWPYFDNVNTGGFGYYYYNAFVTKYANFQTQANSHDVKLGIGDACEHYLGASWRLPTAVELSAITGNATEGAWVPWADASITGKWTNNGPPAAATKGAWFGPNSRAGVPTVATDLFFPASGHRNYNSGAFYQVGTGGFAWSSSVADYHYGFYLQVNESLGVIPRNADYRANVFPVRCVKR